MRPRSTGPRSLTIAEGRPSPLEEMVDLERVEAIHRAGEGLTPEELLPLEHEMSGASWKSIGRDGEGARDEPHDPVVRATRSCMRPIGPFRTRPARHAGGAMPGRVVAIRIELTPPIAG